MSALAERGHLTIDGMRLEYRRLGPQPEDALTLVLLHEGLGCVDLWRDFPERLAAALPESSVFAYSRRGYGRSDPAPLPRPLDYMQQEAREVLPPLLDTIGARKVVLIGHSDGASIAAYYAGTAHDPRLRGVVLISPHFFNEQKCVDSIERARTAYEEDDLRARLERYHGGNVDCAFRGWNDAWLDPGFWEWNIEEALPGIAVPLLILQGDDDPYGTLAHAEAAQAQCRCRLDIVILEGCGHTPFREAAGQTDRAIVEFVRGLEAQETTRQGARGTPS